MANNIFDKMQKIIDSITCSHKFKFVTGQKIYYTKNEYNQVCIHCDKKRIWCAGIMFQHLLDELDKTQQGVYEERITEYKDIPPQEKKSFFYKGYYIYQIHNKQWRVKYDEDDTFAINDGSFKSRDLAVDFVDHYDRWGREGDL